MGRTTTSSGTPFYVPYDQIAPMVNKRGEKFVTLWQAFPWLTRFYTKFGACCVCVCRRGVYWRGVRGRWVR